MRSLDFYFYIGFVIAIAGVILISMNGQKSFNLNPLGDGLAFLAMISWGAYSALVKKIGEWDYPTIAVTRRIYFYGIIFLIPVLIQQKASWDPDLIRNPQSWGISFSWDWGQVHLASCYGTWQPNGSAL